MRKLSADELAQRADHGLTRSIIANLENGRKRDVTTAQLLALAYVLHVSPVDLLFDLRIPYAYVELIPAGEGRDEVRSPVWTTREWVGGRLNSVELSPLVNREPLSDDDVEAAGWLAAADRNLARDIQLRSTLMMRAERLRLEIHMATVEAHAKIRADVWVYSDDEAAQEAALRTPAVLALKEQLRDVHAELYELESSLRTRQVNLDNPVHPDQRVPAMGW